MIVNHKTGSAFTGILYARKNGIISNPVYSCKYADRLLIPHIIEADAKNAGIKIRKDPEFNKVIVETGYDVKLNFLDKIRFLVNKEQQDMLTQKASGGYDSLIYKLSEDEYANLRAKNSKSFQQKLDIFSNILFKNAPEDLKPFIKEYFS